MKVVVPRFRKNAANLFAMSKVANLIFHSEHGVKQTDVLKCFATKKALFITEARKLRGYDYLEDFPDDFSSWNSKKKDSLSVNIASCLNVIRLPVQYPKAEGGWYMTWIPNMANAHETDVVRALEYFYAHIMPNLASRDTLSVEDFKNLKATMPPGMNPLVDYLVCKLAPELHTGLGITQGRAKSLLGTLRSRVPTAMVLATTRDGDVSRQCGEHDGKKQGFNGHGARHDARRRCLASMWRARWKEAVNKTLLI
jgi:hypothetical protein